MKKCDVKCLTLKIIMTIYLKRLEMHENWGINSLSVPGGQKMIFPDMEWCIRKCPGLCTVFFKTTCSKWYLKFMLYLAVIQMFLDTLDCFHFYAQTVLWGL